MWTLPLPDNKNAIKELVTALTYANGNAKYELSEDDMSIIQEIYTRYEDLSGKADDDLLGAELSTETKQAIHDGYSEVQEKSRLKALRYRLLIATDRCPLCGINQVTDLDHHLPRSKYKAISVYSSNLVPLCHTCNNKKRTLVGTTPDDSFIHVYYDDTPEDKRFLIAETLIVDEALIVNFDIEEVEGLTNSHYRMLKFQINKLNLNSRWKKEINNFLCSHAVSLQMVYGDNSNSNLIVELLLSQEKHFTKMMGLNNWRSSLLASLAKNTDFCNGGFIKSLGLEK